MTQLFNRFARLILTDLEGIILQIDNLRVSFEIDKNSSANPNTATVNVYNMNPEHRGFSEGADHMQLFVGYIGVNRDQELKLVFTGNIKRVKTEKNDKDFITKFENGDGERALTEVNFNKTYQAPNMPSVKQIITDIGNEMIKGTQGVIKVALNQNNIKIDNKAKYLNSVSFSGLAKKHMDQITSSQGAQFSIQDEEIHVMQPTGGITSEIVFLSEKTGLIGIPVKREIDLGKLKVGDVKLEIKKPKKAAKIAKKRKTKEQTKFNGLEFTSLLNTSIRPNSLVVIETSLEDNVISDGLYVVKKAQYSGDTFDGDWTVKCEALEVTDQATLDSVQNQLKGRL